MKKKVYNADGSSGRLRRAMACNAPPALSPWLYDPSSSDCLAPDRCLPQKAERLCGRLSVMDPGQIIATGTPRQLTAAHIKPQVVEIYGESDPALLQQHAMQHCGRRETAGATLFRHTRHTRHADPLLVLLHGQPGVRCLNRPANLEDGRIKRTGRELRG